MRYQKLKIKNIKPLGTTKVCDLSIESAEHYVADNGTINHNTGPQYAASVVVTLSTAQLKDGTTKKGVIVTAKPFKSRFAKPNPVKIHIDFSEGMNPYVGLHEFISWDICGIERGKFDKDGKFEPKATATRFAVKHLGKTVTLKELFTSEVFTPEVLKDLNEKVIKPHFTYSTAEGEDDLITMVNGDYVNTDSGDNV